MQRDHKKSIPTRRIKSLTEKMLLSENFEWWESKEEEEEEEKEKEEKVGVQILDRHLHI